MIEAVKALGVLGLALTACACGASPAARGPGSAPDPSLKLKEDAIMEWRGQFSQVAQPGTRVLRDETDWARTWADIGSAPPGKPDFTTRIGAAVFLGQRTTGGYGVRWLQPRRRADTLVIGYQVIEPTGLAIQVLTQPYALKLFPREGAAEAVVAEERP